MKILLFILFTLLSSLVFSQAGNRDSTYGIYGVGQNSFPMYGIRAIAIQSDGKAIAVGESWSSAFGIVRFKTNGSLDSSFGSNGMVDIAVGAGGGWATGVKIQPDGKIVVGGQVHDNNGKWCFGIIRLNADGSLDNSFNGTGAAIVSAGNLYDYCMAIALQPDGKIVAVAQSRSSGPPIIQFGVVRINSNGTIDNTFGTGGALMTSIGNSIAAPSCVAVQPDGKILVGGSSGLGAGPPNSFALIRYNNNGTLDTTFGTGGKDTTFFGGGGSTGSSSDDDEGYSLALQLDGKIIFAGTSNLGSDTVVPLTMLRYNIDGSLDNSFGINGKVRQIMPFGYSGYARTLLLQPDNKIVLSGVCYSPSPLIGAYFVLSRYISTGSLDSTFGINGIVVDSLDHSHDNEIWSSALSPEGKIIVGGNSGVGFTIARYLSGLNVGVPPIPQQNNELLIYPNPADNNLHVHYLNAGEKPTAINIFDITGKLVLTKPCTNFTGDMDIDVIELPQGMYFVKVGSAAKKFVKE